MGAQQVLRGRAVREDARDPRVRPDRPAGRASRARFRNARRRVRPVRRLRALSRARRRRRQNSRRPVRGRGLHHVAPSKHTRHTRLARRRGAGQMQARRPHPQRRSGSARGRAGSGGGIGVRTGRGSRAGRVRVRTGDRPPAVRLPERDRHAPPRCLDRRGHRSRRSPGGRAAAVRAPGRSCHQRGQHPGDRARGHGRARAVRPAVPIAGSDRKRAGRRLDDRPDRNRVSGTDRRPGYAAAVDPDDHRRALRAHRGRRQRGQRPGDGATSEESTSARPSAAAPGTTPISFGSRSRPAASACAWPAR